MNTNDRIDYANTWRQMSQKMQDAMYNYQNKHSLSCEDVAGELGCTIDVVKGILYGNANFSYDAIDYIGNRLSINVAAIKSHIGSPPTLFNCSQTSGFVYKVVGCDVEGMHRLNYIDSFMDIIAAIKKDYSLEYAGCRNDIFEQNICVVDSRMDEILNAAILMQVGYLEGQASSSIPDMCAALTALNPIAVRNPKVFYEAKLKAFLFASFAGMTASTEWNGRKKLTGGYIDVDKEGELLYYRAISDDIFENYLFKHTYVDRPDRGVNKTLAVAEARAYIDNNRELTEAERNKIVYKNGVSGTRNSKKGDFGYVYQDGDDFYIAINFQIRFR